MRANTGHGINYSPIEKQGPIDSTENDKVSPPQGTENAVTSDSLWQRSPEKLNPSNFTWFVGWAWDLFLTLVPICFVVLAHVALYLDGQPKSDYGQRVLELTRISPSLYPILFAAVASRFYKNFARWYLERPDGVGLAVLEQIFGSQSFASAFERVFSIRTHIIIGVTILLTWAMSPLGGQSASRILFFGNGTTTSTGTINYFHPSYQVSSYNSWTSSGNTKGSVAALCSSSLLSSLEQKRSSRDLWDLPKIPQWKRGKKMGETYDVDQEALEKGVDYYASLLGIKVQGLSLASGETRYNFSVQTSYIDFQCVFVSDNVTLDVDNEDAATTFFANVTSPISWKEWTSLDSPPPLHMLYLSKRDVRPSVWSAINCTMQTILLETDIHCGPRPSARSCFAHRQRRVKGDISANRLPKLMIKSPTAMQQAISLWPKASGEMRGDKASATENYIMEEDQPFAGQDLREWSEKDRSIFPDVFSRRFTTAFNTFWHATLNPLGHTNVTFNAMQYDNTASPNEFNTQPFMNTTIGTVTVTREVYRASRLWIAILLTTTIFLEILAILGLVLEVFILGPEVLGFASSMTRDNLYVPLPPGGSNLDGPERARMLQHLRLQLADVRPKDEVGHLAVRAVPCGVVQKTSRERVTGQAGESVSWRPLDRKRLYD
ncbi:hypothetical protein FSARC_6173 [Fusarium sarcochroum]|uniref:Uncharacterized protein n=1 Tax=Fusarium sarcochroum TaxID=1208366 RepID=A0A8H4X8S0_9HYPO|nr:hypothetical protein FSARC_6173 [Fusarium sarcochroum]